jgi:hypothetical protein
MPPEPADMAQTMAHLTVTEINTRRFARDAGPESDHSL